MKKNLNKHIGAAFLMLVMSGITLSGCLQTKSNQPQPGINVQVKSEQLDPAQWYETVQWHSTDAVKALLVSGADPDQIFFNGETALHLAVEQGSYDLTELLLAYGADVNIQERRDGFTPLMYAAIKDDRKMMQLLVSHGADLTKTDIEGFSAYHFLAYRQNRAAMRLLAGNAPIPDQLPTHDGLAVADIATLQKKSARMALAYADHPY